jgi:deoxyribonuclease-4
MRIGAHVSAAGGLFHAPENAAALGLQTFQFFSRPPQGGKSNPITPEEADRFKEACKAGGFSTYYVHAPYIINLASKEARIRHSSQEIIKKELERASTLGATAMMFHPGSAGAEGTKEDGVEAVAKGLRAILESYEGSCRCLVEISAGAGNVIGDTFDEVAAILEKVGRDDLGVCFDTAHAFASGYDLRTTDDVAATRKAFDKAIGLERLVMAHCNDSKVDLGARKDRHEHLGHGKIGAAGMAAIVEDKMFSGLDLILETEPGDLRTEDIAFLRKHQ